MLLTVLHNEIEMTTALRESRHMLLSYLGVTPTNAKGTSMHNKRGSVVTLRNAITNRLCLSI